MSLMWWDAFFVSAFMFAATAAAPPAAGQREMISKDRRRHGIDTPAASPKPRPGAFVQYVVTEPEASDDVAAYFVWETIPVANRTTDSFSVLASARVWFENGARGYFGTRIARGADGGDRHEMQQVEFSVSDVSSAPVGSTGNSCERWRSSTSAPGLSSGSRCTQSHEFVEGSAYFLRLSRVGNNGTGDLWSASITDTRAGTAPVVFGQLYLPNTPGHSGFGGVSVQGSVSLEYPVANGCAGQALSSVGIMGPWWKNGSVTPTQAFGGYAKGCAFADIGTCIYGAGCGPQRVLLTAGGTTVRKYTNTSEPLWRPNAPTLHMPPSKLMPATATTADPDPTASDPYFPLYHLRPAIGHVNDPNGPFRDPDTGIFHLFMQYCRSDKCAYGPGGKGWAHFASSDLVRWTDLGYALGAGPDGVGAGTCPDDVGVFTGSATVLPVAADGGPSSSVVLAFPGVHNLTLYNGTVTHTRCEAQPTFADGGCMSFCTAVPANRSDPLLRHWTSREIIPHQPPGDMNWRFLDASEMWPSTDRATGETRWWMFTGGSSEWWDGSDRGKLCRSNPNCSSEGVSMLYSTADPVHGTWRVEHSLFTTNFSTDSPCKFISCPEMFSLPGMGPPPGSYATGRHVFVAACAGNLYWFGDFDEDTKRLTVDREGGMGCGSKYTDQSSGGCNRLVYGNNHACKSAWDAASARRLMWCWIRSEGPRAALGLDWDGMLSVPRVISVDPLRPNRLLTLPAREVDALRTAMLVNVATTLNASSSQGLVYLGVGNALDIQVTFTLGEAMAAACDSAGCKFGVKLLGNNSQTGSGSTSAAMATVVFEFAKSGDKILPLNTSGVVWIDLTRSGSNVTAGRSCAPVHAQSGLAYTMRVLLDRSVIEVFSQDGVSVLSDLLFLPRGEVIADVAFFVDSTATSVGDDAVGLQAAVYSMGSAYSD